MYLRSIVLLLLVPAYLISREALHPWNDYLTQAQPKDRAFELLQTKCNFCHAVKKRTELFTLNNMDSLASEINSQVFVKRKMPKGKKVTLSAEEETILKDWIELTLD